MKLEEIIVEIDKIYYKIKEAKNILEINKIKEDYAKLYILYKNELNNENFSEEHKKTIGSLVDILDKLFINTINLTNFVNSLDNLN